MAQGFLLQVCVDPEKRVDRRKTQGAEWIHRSEAVVIENVIIECSTTVKVGEEFGYYAPFLEARLHRNPEEQAQRTDRILKALKDAW